MGFTKEVSSLTCLRRAWGSWHGAAGAAVGFMFAVSLLSFQAWLTSALQPMNLEIGRVDVLGVPTLAGQHYALALDVRSPVSTRCERLSIQSLQSDRPGKQEFIPLAAAINGGAWEAARTLPDGASHATDGYLSFTLRLDVGANIPDGEYLLIYKSQYDCSVLGITRRSYHVVTRRVSLYPR